MRKEMERLNNKYRLDCFLDSELKSESDDGEEYKYEHNTPLNCCIQNH